MLIKTPQRVLAIVGGAFLIGTGQAVFFGPITLGPANLTTGTGDVIPDPSRATPADPEQAPSPEDVILDPSALEQAAQDAMAEIPIDIIPPSASFTGAPDALLDASVPEGSLTLREAHQLWEQGAYFIDARHEHEFDTGHIQYAAFLESQLFDTDSARAYAVMDSIPQDATIVLYCVGGECDASKNTAALLEQFGYTDLRIMGAGYEHWVAAGFPIETTEPAGGAP